MRVLGERLVTALGCLAWFVGGGLVAQAPSESESPAVAEHRVPATVEPIEIDGIMDEPAWDSALVRDLPFETYPGENVTAPVDTECRLTYDQKNLYLGCLARDPEPARIRARITDRDTAWRDDFVGIYLDTFNDERRAFAFFINPLGVQMDLTFNDLADNRDQEDPTWVAIGR